MDTASGVLGELPQPAKVLPALRPGDTLGRLEARPAGRSLRHLIGTMDEARDRVKFPEPPRNHPSTSRSKLVFHLMEIRTLAKQRDVAREQTPVGSCVRQNQLGLAEVKEQLTQPPKEHGS